MVRNMGGLVITESTAKASVERAPSNRALREQRRHVPLTHTLTDRRLRRESQIDRPSTAKPAAQRRNRDARTTRPLCQRKRGALERQQANARTVVDLLLPSRPLHVARLVVAVVLHAVDLVLFRRSNANVFAKRLERSAPARADGYASASVATELRILGVMTAREHAAPDPEPRISVFPCHFGSLALNA